MSEREIDLRELELRDRPRFLLSRHRAAVIVLVGYAALAQCARLFLSYLASAQDHHDARDEQAAMIFAGVMAVLCVKALVNIYRPVKPFA